MNFTPIPLVFALASQAHRSDQTTRAITCMGPEGPLTVNSIISSGGKTSSQQMNAPFRLIFWVSPCIMPLFVIPETDHLTSVLGYIRFSLSIVAPQGVPSTARFVDAEINICFYDKSFIKFFGSSTKLKKQNSCQFSRNCKCQPSECGQGEGSR
jgi:hypothetical protein